jgi:LysM repeat protein
MKNNLVLLLLSLILVISMNIAPVSASTNSPSNIYVVETGDTLPDIANKYGTSIEDLKRSNGLYSETLMAGQKLLVPITFEVGTGDTLREIALVYHSTVELIKTINGITSEQIYPGQILKITPKRLTMQGQYILMTREEFKVWLLNNRFNRKISIIQQHHTWLPSYKQFKGNNYFPMLKGMENHHIKTMGWSNIAQNLTIFPDGKVAVSRPFNIAPEGSIGPKANVEGIAIENVGNFDLGYDVMTQEQKESIVYVTALLCIKFGLTPSIDSITYHHWWNYKTKERVLDNAKSYDVKTCPGTGFFGGNTTTCAQNYFYPVVSDKVKQISESLQ